MQKINLELKDKPLEPLLNKKSLIFTPRKIALFLFLIFLAFTVFYFWREICFLIKPPILEVIQPPADIVLTQSNFEIIGKTVPFAVVTINSDEVYVDEEGNFKKSVNLVSGLNIFKIEAKNRFGKANTIIRRINFNQ